MVASLPGLPPIPRAVVDSALRRLGDWESSVDRPWWTVPNQQLELPPSRLSEFTVHADQPEQLLRFQSCQTERQFWLDTLPNIEPNILRVSRFRQCGAYSWVSQDLETGQLFLRGEGCKLRICPVCRRRIQAKASLRVRDFMDSDPDQTWQFHTYTLKHSADPLPQQLDRLVRCFRKLRQRKHWKQSIKHGYAVLEVTFHRAGSYSPNGRFREHDEWHPHLHAVVATEWVDWSWLHTAWLEVTGDSDNVDCERCDSSNHAAHYVAKYIGKPPDVNLHGNTHRAAEYYHSLQHRRMLMPFGATARHRLPPQPPRSETVQVCRFSELLTSAANGNYPARCMLAYIILGTVPRPVVRQNEQQHLYKRGPPCTVAPY